MDLMLDLETLGTLPNSVIISIGAVTFDYNNYTNGISSKFYATIKPDLKNYSVTYDTISWWMKQSEEAKQVFNHTSISTFEALYRFRSWLSTVTIQNIWAHPSSFDIVIIENALRKEAIEIPWNYRQIRDSRTLLDTTGIKIANTGIHHNALDDATAQALAVIEAHKLIESWKYKFDERDKL